MLHVLKITKQVFELDDSATMKSATMKQIYQICHFYPQFRAI